MPWLTIITWVISFLVSYSKTKDAGKSALIATGVAAAAYYTVEPTNETAIWGEASRDLFGMSVPEGTEAVDGSDPTPKGVTPIIGAATQLGKTALTSVADVAKSWGPAGTLGVVAGTTALSSTSSSTWLWIAAAAAAFLLLKN